MSANAAFSPGYYRVVAMLHEQSPFLSPSQSPPYVRDVCDFLTADGSQHIAEVGPGYGQVLAALGLVAIRGVQVWAIDSCPEFLHLARQSWDARATLKTLRVDLRDAATPAIAELHRRVDSLVAINVLQDLDLTRALTLFARWLRPGGRLRATVLAKETMDSIYRHHPLYNSRTGRYYKPRAGGPALGEREVGEKVIQYERVLQYHTLPQARRAFAKAGLRITAERCIAFEANEMIDRWITAGTLAEFSSKALSDLRVAGIYVDAYELSARCMR